MVEHRAPDGLGETPLKAYLSRAYPLLPEWALRDALKRRDVRVNGARGAQTVRGGDEIRLYLPHSFFARELPILYEDEAILAVEKPCGLPVDVDADGVGEDTVQARLSAMRPGAGIAHRLDAGTGGALLAGKHNAALERLFAAFAAGEVQKEYHAVVLGRVSGERLLEARLFKDARAAHVSVRQAASGGKQIVTRYRALGSWEERGVWLTRLSVQIFTGRTHQIRAHLASEGMPLLGDDKYGDRAANRALGVFAPQLWCRRLKYGETEILSEPKGRFFTR